MNKSKKIMIVLLACLILQGCSPITRTKQEIPKAVYTKIGYGIKGEIEQDGTIKLTYALVGLNKDKIKGLYIDQIEQNPSRDRHLMTNKELGNAYGLSYMSDHGEWNEQVRALENYIAGHSMTIENFNAIAVESLEDGRKKVPKKGTDLEAGCELDIADFLEVIQIACANAEDVEAMRLGVGEDIRVSQQANRLDISIGFFATDYRSKICYNKMDFYSLEGKYDADIRSQKQKADEEQEWREWRESLTALETYLQGLNYIEACGLETYDPGNGVDTALPKPNTDLAKICNIDLSKWISVISEASNKLI